MKPSFCATCIDREPVRRTDLDGRTVWLCTDCYDGADKGPTRTPEQIQDAHFVSMVRRTMRMNPDASLASIVEYMGLSPFVDANVGAEYQRVLRIVKKVTP